MGYSKWKKILTILMIINILFVLFAKFNKVFGAYTYTFDDVKSGNSFTLNNYTLTVPDFVFDYKYILVTRHGSYWTLIISNNELIYDKPNSQNWHDSIGTKAYLVDHIKNGVDNIFYRLNFSGYNSDVSSYTLSKFTKMTSYSGSVDNSPDFPDTGPNAVYFTCNFEVKDLSGNLIFDGKPFVSPFFSTPTTDIQNLAFNNLFIESGDWDTSIPLYLHCLEITNIIDNGNNTNTYYYNDNIFLLDNKSKYYEQFFDTENYYFSVPKYNFSFNANTSYLLVLNDTVNSYNNSIGLIDKDLEKNIFQSVLIDTSGKITATDTINDNISNIKDEMSDNTISSETETELENSLHFDNKNEELKNINNNFFSRLTTMISNLVGYDLGEDTLIKIPMPYSDKTIILHSNILYKNVTGALRVIINAFWFYLFSFYLYKFVNKLYIAISTGNILDTFSSDGEAITNNML